MMRACGICLLTMSAAVSAWGCSQRAEPVPTASGRVRFPEMFELDDVMWKRVPQITEADIRRLSDYFDRNPSVAENSLVAGDPVVYSADSKARRFYWSAVAIDDVEWLCIEFGRGPVRLLDGRGDPFRNASERVGGL